MFVTRLESSKSGVRCLRVGRPYIFEQEGRFPGTFTTTVLPGYVQAVHLDIDYYDRDPRPGAYPESHADHWDTWHRRYSPTDE